jgi:CheY-like chemotaxis protein
LKNLDSQKAHYMAEQRTVLVVEDEPLVRLDLATRLADTGYLVFEASSAAEAIATLERHPQIRVIFTDIQMPGDMDGLALARYVRDRWPPTIIVVSSGRPEPGEMPDDVSFLAKPYESGRLRTILDEVAARLA